MPAIATAVLMPRASGLSVVVIAGLDVHVNSLRASAPADRTSSPADALPKFGAVACQAVSGKLNCCGDQVVQDWGHLQSTPFGIESCVRLVAAIGPSAHVNLLQTLLEFSASALSLPAEGVGIG